MGILEELLHQAWGKPKSYNIIISPDISGIEQQLEVLLKASSVNYKHIKSGRYFEFENGTRVCVQSSDSPERLRGCNVDFCVIIQASKIADLDYLEKSILFPATIHTNGIIKKYE